MVSGVWYVEVYTVGDDRQWSWWLGVCVESWSCYICTYTYAAMSAMPAHVACIMAVYCDFK